jgi:multimeric flavodoxin WrbA
MKTLILADRRSTDYNGADLSRLVKSATENAGCETDIIIVNGDEIDPCLGCFMCWVKTPGTCIDTGDPANAIAAALMRSETIVLLSEITYGGFSFDTKSFLDRSIQNLLPFFEVVAGEMRHPLRYERFPDMLVIGFGQRAPGEEQTFARIVERNVLNMRPARHFVHILDDSDNVDKTLLSLRDFLDEALRVSKGHLS